jgi:hypothetical protein
MQRPINFSSSNRFGERGIAGISLGGIECGTLPQSRQFASAKQNRAYRQAFTACAREHQRGCARPRYPAHVIEGALFSGLDRFAFSIGANASWKSPHCDATEEQLHP